MAAGNGFLTEIPDARYGDDEATFDNARPWSLRGTCPGSGTYEVIEIGIYGYFSGTNNIIFGIFTDDAGNANPDTLVTNSQSDAIVIPNAMAKVSFTYVTKPQLTGGTVYWITAQQSLGINMSRFAAGGTAFYINGGMTYPTWPTPAEWDAGSDLTRDYSLYAVVQEVAGGGIVVLRRRRM